MSKTARAKKRVSFRAIALILPAAALSLSGCGPNREEELNKEIARLQQELQQAKAAQQAAEKTTEEAKAAYSCPQIITEDATDPDENENSGNADESNGEITQNMQTGPVSNPGSPDSRNAN